MMIKIFFRKRLLKLENAHFQIKELSKVPAQLFFFNIPTKHLVMTFQNTM